MASEQSKTTVRPPLPPPEPDSGYHYTDNHGNWELDPKQTPIWRLILNAFRRRLKND